MLRLVSIPAAKASPCSPQNIPVPALLLPALLLLTKTSNAQMLLTWPQLCTLHSWSSTEASSGLPRRRKVQRCKPERLEDSKVGSVSWPLSNLSSHQCSHGFWIFICRRKNDVHVEWFAKFHLHMGKGAEEIRQWL